MKDYEVISSKKNAEGRKKISGQNIHQ